jgi:apolipoprotein N-acyltransferase
MRFFARPDVRTLASGVLIVLAFPPYGIWPLIWIALVPWLLALRRTANWKQALAQGVWLSFTMTVLGFHWVAFVIHEYGEVPWPLAILGLLLFALVGQPQFLVFGALARKFLKAESPGLRGAALALTLALAYTGIDWMMPKQWADTLGHSLYLARNLRQIADLGGAALLTTLVYLANDLISKLWLRIRGRAEPSLLPALSATFPQAAATLALFIAAWIYGHARSVKIRGLQQSPAAQVQMGVIQANIGDFDKIAAERGSAEGSEKVLSTFFGLSDQALAEVPKPQALVWPETSYPGTFRTPQEASDLYRDQKVERFVRSRGVPLYFGAYDHSGRKDFNALFFLSPKATPGVAGEGDLQVYRKTILLLFGEYIPGAESIKWLRDQFPQVGNFGHGPGPTAYDVPTTHPALPTIRVVPAICYEALFPAFGIGGARQGAQAILNVTNDSWFGPYGEPQLHLALSTFRSVETRLPLVRSTNTGISALIMPDGEITHATPIGEPVVMNVSVPILPKVWTLVVAWGEWFGGAALGAGLAGLLLFARDERRRVVKSKR